MEEYRNKVINLQAINPRISVNLPVKLAGTNPKVRGGAIGACPSSEPSRGRIPPPEGAMGHGPTPKGGPPGKGQLGSTVSPTANPLGAMGTNSNGPHGHPSLGGGDAAARRPMAPGEGNKRLPLYDFHRFFRLSWDNTESLVGRSCLLC